MSNRTKVLVIEDVNFSREALVSMLTQLDCDVHQAGSGHAALEKLGQQQYDLVLIDLELDDMEGMTIAETLRYHTEGQPNPVPLIALTSYHDDYFKEQALSSGMDDFLAKPLTFDSAVQLLKKWTKQLVTE